MAEAALTSSEGVPSPLAAARNERLAMDPHVSQSTAYRTGWWDEAATKLQQLRDEAQVSQIPRLLCRRGSLSPVMCTPQLQLSLNIIVITLHA